MSATCSFCASSPDSTPRRSARWSAWAPGRCGPSSAGGSWRCERSFLEKPYNCERPRRFHRRDGTRYGTERRGLEQLLSGMTPAGGGLDDLGALVRSVQVAYHVVPEKAVEDRHVQHIMAASQLLADKGNPVVRPASKAHGSARQTSGLPKWRRKTVLSALFASLGMKWPWPPQLRREALPPPGNFRTPPRRLLATSSRRSAYTSRTRARPSGSCGPACCRR